VNVRHCLILSFALALATTAMTARAAANGSVVGVVVDSDRKGVEHVDVRIYAADDKDAKTPLASAVTAADGKFTLKDVPVGTNYTVKAVKRKSFLGVRAEKADVSVQDGKATDVGELELKVPAKKQSRD
jgi:hypothetical protein